MTPRNERHRASRLPNTVCACEKWAIFDGEDRCAKCGKLWPSAYGRQAQSKNGNYQLLLRAIDRQRDKARVGRHSRYQA